MGQKIADFYAEIGGDVEPLRRALDLAKTKLKELERASEQAARNTADDFTRRGADFRTIGGSVDDYIGRLKASTPEMAKFGLRYAEITGGFETGALSSQEATKQLEALSTEMKQAQQPADQLNKKYKGLSGTLDSFKSQILPAAAILGGFTVGLKKAWEAAGEGAEMEYAKQKFSRLAESIGTTSDALMIDLRTATKNTRSDMELTASAADLMGLGLVKNHEQAVRLVTVVAGLGMDTNQLVLALTNQTTARFDQLNVSVEGFDEKVQHLEESGLSANEAFTEAFLQQAEEQLEKVGNKADTAAGNMQKMETNIKNMVDNTKPYLARFASNFATSINVIFFGKNEIQDALRAHEQAVRDTVGSYDEYVTEMQRAAKAAGYHYDELGQLRNGLNKVQEGHYLWSEQVWETAESLDYADRMTRNLTTSDGKLATVINGTVKNSMKPLTEEFLQQRIMSNLSGEALLEYSREIGALNETSYSTLKGLEELTDRFDTNTDEVVDGAEATAEYWAALDDLQDKFGDVSGAAGDAKSEIEKLNDLDLNLAGTIKGEIDKLKHYLSPEYMAIDATVTEIQNALLKGTITEEQAYEFYRQLYAGAEGVDAKLGEIDPSEAAKRISEELGIPFSKALKLVQDIDKGLRDIPAEVHSSIIITEYRNVVDHVPNKDAGGRVVRNSDKVEWATGGSFLIPSGYTETYPIGPNQTASSGEVVTVTPVGQTPGNGIVIHIENANFADPVNYEAQVYEFAEDLKRRMN